MPLGFPQGDACVLPYSEVGSETGTGETKGAEKSFRRLKGKIDQIWSHIALIAVTLFVLVLMVEILWSPAGSSITDLRDGNVYGGVALTSLLVAYMALALRKAHQYASRLALIGVVGLIVLLAGWALKGV